MASTEKKVILKCSKKTDIRPVSPNLVIEKKL